MSPSIIRDQPIADFQLTIAKRWRSRGQNSQDPYAKFLYFFMGFNALYFLWDQVDGEGGGEVKQIGNLLSRIDCKVASAGLERAAASTNFFLGRAHSIERMDKRSVSHPGRGNADEGRKWSRQLLASNPVERLVALGQILYIVR